VRWKSGNARRSDAITAFTPCGPGAPPLALPPGEALDTVWALTSPELHQLLVRVRGWKRRRYTKWLAETLARLLLRLA
jgi:hypothetical protein